MIVPAKSALGKPSTLIPSLLVSAALLGLSGCQTLQTLRPDHTAQPVATESATPAAGSVGESSPEAQAETETVASSVSVSPQPVIETAQADVWLRIRNGMQLTIPDKPRVQQELDWYLAHPEYIDRVQERAQPYLYHIVEEIERRGLPMELALLPVVESAFQPFAYSPGRAAGLWQFIPGTGRLYGLKQNWWYDGRRDVVAASDAALRYLEQLAKEFDGDWELALASYNAGAGNVRKAIRRNERRGKPTDFWSLKLPRETSGYVPRLLAISKLVAEADRHGIALRPIPDEPYFEQVDIGGQLDLARAAEMADVSLEDLYQLNPAFNRWATDPDGPHRLLLPLDKADGFKQALAILPAQDRLSWKRYRIRQGDSLSVIARKHNTTVSVLRQVNKLRGNNIRAGRHLLIPVSSQALSEYTLSASERRESIQQTPRKGTRLSYEVQPGDSLWAIARAHGVNHRQLARWNGMSPLDTLRPGQTLVIWSKTTSAAPKSSVGRKVAFDTQSTLRYRVRKGDSLSRIAQRFNVSVADLRKWNRLGRYLQPGQMLKVQVDVTNQTL